ncbi:putative glycerate kinase [Thermoplasmatales archaeon SCGC AB-539-N05]|nr:putative glycerate kinase [Thermoplasmatales archaeon SCGC AB-539-N05]
MTSFGDREILVGNGKTRELQNARRDALDILLSAVNVVDPYKVVTSRFTGHMLVFQSQQFDIDSYKNVFLAGFGKASVSMAQAVCDTVPITKGMVLTNDSQAWVNHTDVKTIHGTHPLPSENNVNGTKIMLELVKNCGKDDLLIVLISGGGSALLCHPSISLYDLQKTTDLLLKSGATIQEINTVRKHLSYVKGGQLVKEAKCTVVSLIISDVVGDPLEFIASGPTCPDRTTYNDAKHVLEKYRLWEVVPHDVRHHIEKGVNGEICETPKENGSLFKNVHNFVVANNDLACEAASGQARKLGYESQVLSTSLTGESRDVGKNLINLAKKIGREGTRKTALIAGGETTVTIKGKGEGGRNQEMVLAVVNEIADEKMVFASFATDGIDGNSDAAGAIADGNTFLRTKEKKLDPEHYLRNNDSYAFFKQLDDLLISGLTGTNVVDIQLILIF